MCAVLLVLVGAGEHYICWLAAQRAAAAADSRRFLQATGIASSSAGFDGTTMASIACSPDVRRTIAEENAKLNAVALFFLKQSFRHLRFRAVIYYQSFERACLIFCRFAFARV